MTVDVACFPREPGSASAARRFVGELLPHTLPGEARDTVLLLTSEVVTNALVHAGSPVVVRAAVEREHVEISVDDLGAGLPRAAVPGFDAESHRGMLLVDRLADAWGVEPRDVGKAVWFRLRASRSSAGATRRREPTEAAR